MFPIVVTSGRSTITVTGDEHARPESTMETLGALAPVFREGGSVTAGNSSGITDGAAAMVLMCEGRARCRGPRSLGPDHRDELGRSADPEIMGIGPVPATRRRSSSAPAWRWQISI